MPVFDVFLSHNSIDKPWVAQLKEDLQRYGLSVWLDRDEIRPGDLFAQALEEGLEDSRAVALVISPEAMASGWVKEEYYRALSLAKKKSAPLQLIPVLLRSAEVPGFIESRNWVDFREESRYAQNVARLVWGITGVKPAKALDLAAPAQTAAVPPAGRAPATAPPQAEPGFRTGGIRAKNIRAKNVVTGIQIQGGDAEIARTALELAKNLQTGGIDVSEELIADNVIEGFHYLGQGGTKPTLEQFRQELAALREQLDQAIAAGEIDDDEEAEDARTAAGRAVKQVNAETPAADKLVSNLDKLTHILTRAGEAALAGGKLGAAVIRLAPVAAGLKRLAELIF